MKQKVSRISKIIVAGALIASFAAPVFANERPESAGTPAPQASSVTRDVRKAERQAYVQAVHQANLNYRDARKAARETLRDALKAAGEYTDARHSAIAAYRDAIKTAREAMQAAKKAARETFFAAVTQK